MTKIQRGILLLVAALIIGTVSFPPWKDDEGSFLGHSWLFDPPQDGTRHPVAPDAALKHLRQHPNLKSDFYEKFGYLPREFRVWLPSVAIDALLVEWTAILLAGSLIYLSFSGKSKLRHFAPGAATEHVPINGASSTSDSESAPVAQTQSGNVDRSYVLASLADPQVPEFVKRKLSREHSIEYKAGPVDWKRRIGGWIFWIIAVPLILVAGIVGRELARAVFSS